MDIFKKLIRKYINKKLKHLYDNPIDANPDDIVFFEMISDLLENKW